MRFANFRVVMLVVSLVAIAIPGWSAAATIVFDGVGGTVTGDSDGNPTQFNGRPFTFIPAVGPRGIARFNVTGDVSLSASDVIRGSGPHGIQVTIGGDFTVPAGALIDVSGSFLNFTSLPGPGGGEGGTRGLGGSGGAQVFGSLVKPRQAGGPGGTGHGANGTAGTPGDASDVAPAPNPGQAGTSGGAGAAGLNSGPGGAGGTGGAGGGVVPNLAVATGGIAGGGGPGSVNAGSNGSTGVSGNLGNPGTAGNHGLNGGVPGNAAPGTNTGTGTEISGGSGGGGAGGGGGGGSGSPGSNGGNGGGGGGGGGATDPVSGALTGGVGGTGGSGGNGGYGAPGGNGGDGHIGGSGGGAIAFIVWGTFTSAGTYHAKGEDLHFSQAGTLGLTGGFGTAASPAGQIFGPLPAGPGVVGAGGTSSGPGGAGGMGGDGATGGNGGHGTPGSYGGNGAGGSIKLLASVMLSAGSAVDASGGTRCCSGAGGDGRFIYGSSDGAAFAGSATGASFTAAPGPTRAVPLDVDPAAFAPPIPWLPDGPESYGRAPLHAIQHFGNLIGQIPPGARMAFYKTAQGPAPLDHAFPGYEYLFVLNLSSTPLLMPGLRTASGQLAAAKVTPVGGEVSSIGAGAFGVPNLLIGGPANDPLFGGSGPKTLGQIDPFGVYAVLLPEGAVGIDASYSENNGFVRQSFPAVGSGAPVFVTAGVTPFQGIPALQWPLLVALIALVALATGMLRRAAR